MAAPILTADQVEEAARLLREGGLVAFPTDTVYGVAAMADAGFHSAHLQAFKGGRPQPFALHLPDVESAVRTAEPLFELERHAVRQLGPRGVTVIVAHGAGHEGLGLRIVQHDLGSRFLTLAQAPVVATSANEHGQPPLRDPDSIAALPGITAVLSAGELPERPASSVVRMLRSGLQVLRASALGHEKLAALFTRRVEFVCLGNLNRSAFARGLIESMQAFYAARVKNFIPAWRPSSSGLIANPRAQSPRQMLEVAARYQVDLAGHVPTRFEPGRPQTVDVAVAMGEDIVDALPSARHWTVTDPMGGPEDGYREMAAQVRAHLVSLLARTARVDAADAALEAEFEKLFSPAEGESR